jgi:hypothetical protein
MKYEECQKSTTTYPIRADFSVMKSVWLSPRVEEVVKRTLTPEVLQFAALQHDKKIGDLYFVVYANEKHFSTFRNQENTQLTQIVIEIGAYGRVNNDGVQRVCLTVGCRCSLNVTSYPYENEEGYEVTAWQINFI